MNPFRRLRQLFIREAAQDIAQEAFTEVRLTSEEEQHAVLAAELNTTRVRADAAIERLRGRTAARRERRHLRVVQGGG